MIPDFVSKADGPKRLINLQMNNEQMISFQIAAALLTFKRTLLSHKSANVSNIVIDHTMDMILCYCVETFFRMQP